METPDSNYGSSKYTRVPSGNRSRILSTETPRFSKRRRINDIESSWVVSSRYTRLWEKKTGSIKSMKYCAIFPTNARACVWSLGVVRTVFFNVVPKHNPTHTVLWSYGLDGRVRCTYNDSCSWSVYGERRRAGSLLLLLFVIVVMPSIWHSPRTAMP